MTAIEPPFPKPAKTLFRTTKNYRETISLFPVGGFIPLGRDLEQFPIDCSLFWLNSRLQINCSVGPKGKTLEEARTMGMMKFGTVTLDEFTSTRDIFIMARALCLILLGSIVEVTEVTANPTTGVKSYPVLAWLDEQGNGTCPNCRNPATGHPAFPVGRIYRCPACHAAMVHQQGRLDVLPKAEEKK
jgi:hypothetical protein